MIKLSQYEYIFVYQIQFNLFRLLSINHTFSMKDQNQLQDELFKLKEIAPNPIDLSFTAGYLAFPFPLHFAKEIKPIATQLLMMVQDGLISSENVLEILSVVKLKLFSRDSKNLVKELQEYIQNFINQLALDNAYLRNKYFKKDFEKQEIVLQYLGVQCPICSSEINSMQLCYLSCGHMYHRECLNGHCKQKISSKTIPIPCPSEGCPAQLLQEEITQYLEHSLRDKYDQFSFQNYVDSHMDDTSWCPTPGCSAVFAFDEALTNYKCPACKKHYCLVCKCEFHTGFTCQQYKKVANLSQDDKQFMFLVKGSKYKQCPNCKFWVQKNQGCDHMTCRCKYEFCYICGGKYNRCKCKGFVNEVQEPKMLEPFANVEPIPAIQPAHLMPKPPLPVFPRQSPLSKPWAQYRPIEGKAKMQKLNPVVHRRPNPAEQDQSEMDFERLKAISLRQHEQLQLREDQQMRLAIKESEELEKQSRLREFDYQRELSEQLSFKHFLGMKQKIDQGNRPKIQQIEIKPQKAIYGFRCQRKVQNPFQKEEEMRMNKPVHKPSLFKEQIEALYKQKEVQKKSNLFGDFPKNVTNKFGQIKSSILERISPKKQQDVLKEKLI